MSSKFGPPRNEPWVWQTRELRTNDAWRSAGINARRFVDFLLIEHMNNAGRENGKLKAPEEQLVVFGIGKRYVADAIRDAEQLGLVECVRGGMRVATEYALTWLPLHDGTPATNRWRTYRNPKLRPSPAPEIKKSAPQREGSAAPQREGRSANLPRKGRADDPQNLPLKGRAPSRSFYQGGNDNSDLSEPGASDAAPGLVRGAPLSGVASPATDASARAAKLPWRAPVIVELPRERQRRHREVLKSLRAGEG
jgi:hypothetical protein